MLPLLALGAIAVGTIGACGSAESSEPDNPLLATAGAEYQQFVREQTAELSEQTELFVAAVIAGDAEQAKALYPVARLPWERIEPVAESFGDLDPLIDGRDGDQEAGEDFTGFHRIEQALWETGDLADMAPYAEQLRDDVGQIVDRAAEVELSPLELAQGAKELLDEIATGKITGEEERYSHTDLWDFAGNLEGSVAAIDALRPFLAQEEPELVEQLDERLAAARAELDQYRNGEGWLFYDQLDEDQLRGLSDRITALTESVGQVAAAVAEG
jgi:iron uptake system component EfeO